MNTQSAKNRRVLPSCLSTAIVETVRGRINAIRYIFFEADVRSFEIRIRCDVNVTRIGDTLSYGFLQTVQRDKCDRCLLCFKLLSYLYGAEVIIGAQLNPAPARPFQ